MDATGKPVCYASGSLPRRNPGLSYQHKPHSIYTMSLSRAQSLRYASSPPRVDRTSYYDTYKNNLSDDSYCSAQSHISAISTAKSPEKITAGSTSGIFQNHLANLKKFLRNMPMRRPSMVNSNSNEDKQKSATLPRRPPSWNETSFELSSSPPVCPPPPQDLKSMAFLEQAGIKYTNYDEFTKARNQLTMSYKSQSRDEHDEKDSSTPDAHEDPFSYALTSLPPNFERNLTTVFEEKPNPPNFMFNSRKSLSNRVASAVINQKNSRSPIQLINPPANFTDRQHVETIDNSNSNSNTNSNSGSDSSQSPTSDITTDSLLDYQQPFGSSFRFSYAQPIPKQVPPLPPRVPHAWNSKPLTSSGVSSNDSSLVNGMNNSDYVNNNELINASDGDKTLTGMDSKIDLSVSSNESTFMNGTTCPPNLSELEQKIQALENLVVLKDKKITKLHLKLMSRENRIMLLESTVCKLREESSRPSDRFKSS